jgi:predicted DNA-binding protein (MmcQ/YjbR family)
MLDRRRSDQLLARVRELCLSLPETSEASSWGHPNFRAGKRTFVTFEKINGKDCIAVHLDPFEVSELEKQVGLDRTPYGQGRWISLQLATHPKWSMLEALILKSYRLVALKRMLAALEGQGLAKGDRGASQELVRTDRDD